MMKSVATKMCLLLVGTAVAVGCAPSVEKFTVDKPGEMYGFNMTNTNKKRTKKLRVAPDEVEEEESGLTGSVRYERQEDVRQFDYDSESNVDKSKSLLPEDIASRMKLLRAEDEAAKIAKGLKKVRDLDAELRGAISDPSVCLADYSGSTAKRFEIEIATSIRPTGRVSQPRITGEGLSEKAKTCIAALAVAVKLAALDGDSTESASFSFEVDYKPAVYETEAAPTSAGPRGRGVRGIAGPSGIPIGNQ